MAVGVSTASSAARGIVSVPIRTCLGCRRRAPASDLLRVVAGAPDAADRQVIALVPDPARRAAGRGAWVHPTTACVTVAIRRRAFGRALRVTARIDAAAVLAHVDQISGEQ